MNSRWMRGWSPDEGEPPPTFLSVISLSKGFFSLFFLSLLYGLNRLIGRPSTNRAPMQLIRDILSHQTLIFAPLVESLKPCLLCPALLQLPNFTLPCSNYPTLPYPIPIKFTLPGTALITHFALPGPLNLPCSVGL